MSLVLRLEMNDGYPKATIISNSRVLGGGQQRVHIDKIRGEMEAWECLAVLNLSEILNAGILQHPEIRNVKELDVVTDEPVPQTDRIKTIIERYPVPINFMTVNAHQ